MTGPRTPQPPSGAARPELASELESLDFEAEEPPPVLGSWRRLYALVLAWLAVLIALLWALTKAFA